MDVQCSCGVTLEITAEHLAQDAHCPQCGTRVNDLVQTAVQSPAAVPPTPGTQVAAVMREAAQAAPKISCVNHPAAAASYNCMSCNKPICSICFKQFGYFCGADCKTTAAASTGDDSGPEDSTTATQLIMKRLGTAGKIGAGVLATIAVAIVGYLIFAKITAPRPTILASMAVDSRVATIKVAPMANDATLARISDDITSLQLATQARNWKPIPLLSLERQRTISKEDDDISFYRYRRASLEWKLTHDRYAVLASSRQIVVLDGQTGKVVWELFKNDVTLGGFLSHRDGLLCSWQLGNVNRIVNFRWDTGAEAWSHSDPNCSTPQMILGDAYVFAIYPVKPPAATPTRTESDEEQQEPPATAPVPTTTHIARLLALNDGRVLAEQGINLTGNITLKRAGRLILVNAGTDLFIFDGTAIPAFKLTIKDTFRAAAVNESVLAVSVGSELLAYHPKTGQPLWSRQDIPTVKLVEAPNNILYALLESHTNTLASTELTKYRAAKISLEGRASPVHVRGIAKLDGATGKTLWGVRNIGQEIILHGDQLFSFDTFSWRETESIYSAHIGEYGIRRLSPKSGKEIWTYMQKGFIWQQFLRDDGSFLLLTSAEFPPDRPDPSIAYNISHFAAK